MIRTHSFGRIAATVQPVTPQESARLLEKQWRARVAMRANPFANAMNVRWKHYYRRAATVTTLVAHTKFPDVSWSFPSVLEPDTEQPK